MKRCVKCGDAKPFDAFYKNTPAKPGEKRRTEYRSACKECWRAAQKARPKTNRDPEKKAAYARRSGQRSCPYIPQSERQRIAAKKRLEKEARKRPVLYNAHVITLLAGEDLWLARCVDLTRSCRHCRQTQQLHEFGRNPRGRDRLCKQCDSKLSVEYERRNSVRINERKREQRKIYKRKATRLLPDHRVIDRLRSSGICAKNAPRPLIELVRAHIRLKRLVKERKESK